MPSIQYDAANSKAVPMESVITHIAAFLRRFVFLKNESLYLLIALWVVATYLSEIFDYAGYIFAYSAEPQSGKSRLLEVIAKLNHSSSGILISPTEAVLFHTAHGHTQLLDEVDGWTNKDFLRSILNAGFQKGGMVTRMQRDSKGGYRPVEYPVFAPRALAGIGLKVLEGTTRDRTFAIEMVRQTKAERRERFRFRVLKEEVEGLAASIQVCADTFREAVAKRYESDFSYLEQFGDRTMDVSEPLAAILEVFHADDPALDERRASLLEAIGLTREEQVEDLKEHRIIRALHSLAETTAPLVGNATELAEMCSGLAEEFSHWDISSALQRYGFKTKSIRKGGDPKYRYVLSKEELAEIVERYAHSSGEGETSGPDDPPTTA